MKVGTEFDQAAAAVDRVTRSENEELQSRGIQPSTPAAVPSYTLQIRSDLILVAWLLKFILSYVKAAVALLFVIAALLAIIAVRGA